MLDALKSWFGRRQPVGTDAVDALYQRALAAWNGGDWSVAASICSAAIAREPRLPALHFLLGSSRFELEQYEAALRALSQCLELAPPPPLREQARSRRALARARIDLRGGRAAAEERLRKEQVRGVSVLICSPSAERAAKAEAMHRRLFAEVPHEIVVIGNARSMAEGYNRALAQARYELVVLAHDDIEILNPDFAARLLRALDRHDLIGIAGTRKLDGGAWHLAGYPQLAGQIGMPSPDDGYVVTLYDVATPETGGLQALDGLFLACRRETALRLAFDADAFDGWHLYDLDFSLRAARAGLDCASCNDLLIVHGSQGRYDENWRKYAERFLAKHKLQAAAAAQPEFISLGVRSAEEWRLLTQHLLDGR